MKHKHSLLELALVPALALGIEGCTSSQTGVFQPEANVPSASLDHRLDSVVLNKESRIYGIVGPDIYEWREDIFDLVRPGRAAFTIHGDHDDGPHDYFIDIPGLSKQENLELLKICTTKGAINFRKGSLNHPRLYHELVHREFSKLSKEDQDLLDQCRRQALQYVAVKNVALRNFYESKVKDNTSEFVAQSLAGFDELPAVLNSAIRESFPKTGFTLYKGIGDRALDAAIRYAQSRNVGK